MAHGSPPGRTPGDLLVARSERLVRREALRPELEHHEWHPTTAGSLARDGWSESSEYVPLPTVFCQKLAETVAAGPDSSATESLSWASALRDLVKVGCHISGHVVTYIGTLPLKTKDLRAIPSRVIGFDPYSS